MPVKNVKELGHGRTFVQRVGGNLLQVRSAAGIPAAADDSPEIPVHAAGRGMVAARHRGIEIFGHIQQLIFIG